MKLKLLWSKQTQYISCQLEVISLNAILSLAQCLFDTSGIIFNVLLQVYVFSFCIQIILELQYSGTFAVFLVPCFPRLDLALFATVPLSIALGALLEFLARLDILAAVAAETLQTTFPLLQLIQCITESQVTRFS